jgi:phosphoribosyl-ATP pyrophosphohydrolase
MRIIKLDLDKYTKEQQLEKMKEEMNEVVEAFSEESDSRVIEEIWDLIQACFGLLFMYCSSKMLFVTTYILHTIKMQGRHNEGRIHIEEEMDI